jgi:hypothetical protein
MSPPTRSFTRVADMHAQGNRRSKDDWALYAEHRRRLTATILDLAPVAGGTLCLLGAGNCNDVELPELGARFARIHLVDIDAGALDRARARQAPELRARLQLHGGLDLTGMLVHLDRWKNREPEPAALEQATTEGVAALVKALPAGQADLAVSCCLMSQLGWSLETALGATSSGPAADGEGASLELRLATLTVHLRTLAALCRPGGAALLASDIVSSDIYPIDQLEPGTDLAALAERLIADQTVYAGANPLLSARLLRRDLVLKDAFALPTPLPPWLWTGQFERTYLVYPQLLRRK